MKRFWPNPCIRYQKNIHTVLISKLRMCGEDEMGSKPSLVEKKLHIRQSHKEWEQEDPAAVTLRLSTSNTRFSFVYAFNIRFFSSFSYSPQWDEHNKQRTIITARCPSTSVPTSHKLLLPQRCQALYWKMACFFFYLFRPYWISLVSVGGGGGFSHR